MGGLFSVGYLTQKSDLILLSITVVVDMTMAEATLSAVAGVAFDALYLSGVRRR